MRWLLVTKFVISEKEICLQTHLFNDLWFDSIDILDLVAVMEKDLGIDIKGEELENVKLIRDLVLLISRKLNGASMKSI
jgi:acyl carrier protein